MGRKETKLTKSSGKLSKCMITMIKKAQHLKLLVKKQSGCFETQFIL